MSNIKAVIFDIGNVIVREDFGAPADALQVSEKECRRALYHERDHYLNRYMTGTLSFEAYATFFFGQLGPESNTHSLDLLRSSLRSYWHSPDLEVISLIRRISPDIRRALLSNSWPELEERARSFNGTPYAFMPLFEPYVYFSHNIGVRKPDAKAFQAVVDSLKVPAATCLFIDDKKRNTDAAESLGMRCHLYSTPAALEKCLDSYGLLQDRSQKK